MFITMGTVNQENNMEKIEAMRKVFNREPKLIEEFSKVIDSIKLFMIKNNGWEAIESFIDKAVQLMGSLADGCCSARMFAEEIPHYEGDILIELPITITPAMVTPVSDRPGFYTMRYDQKLVDNLSMAFRFLQLQTDPVASSRMQELLENVKKDGVFRGTFIKKLVQSYSGFNHEKSTFEEIAAEAFSVEKDQVKCNTKDEYNGPAVTIINDTFLDSDHKFTMSEDIVICVPLLFWPQEAAEWGERDRKWPPLNVITQIIKEHKVHLVAKPSEDEHDDQHRLTFLAEKNIIQQWTSDMKLTYYIFKTLFYCYFKQEVHDGKSLSSYLAKTTMYWVSETLDPEAWTESDMNTNLKILLKKLCDWLEAGVLPHYFVRGINLLLNVDPELLKKVVSLDKSKLMADPISAIPDKFDPVHSHMDLFCKLSTSWLKIFGRKTNGIIRPIQQQYQAPVEDDLD